MNKMDVHSLIACCLFMPLLSFVLYLLQLYLKMYRST